MSCSIFDKFLILLRAGLWENQPPGNPNLFSLESEEWNYLYNLSKAHTVEGIIYEGILKLPSEFYPPFNLLLKWTAVIDGIERYNLKMKNTMIDMAHSLKNHGSSVVLLKGFGLGNNYIKPNLRISGDVDFYFETKMDFDLAIDYLQKNNIAYKNGDHGSIYYKYNNTEFEHHVKMIDLFNPFVRKSLKDIENIERGNYTYLDKEKFNISIPSYNIMQIQANAHILKHFLGFGIGLRQFCDVARLCSIDTENYNGKVLKNYFKKLKIYKWIELVFSFLINHLGLPKNNIPFEITLNEDTDWLKDEILNSGNFGFYQQSFNRGGNLERESSRSDFFNRVLPHLKKGLKYCPYEAVFYPISKIYTKLT